jgi:WD40 repeat protein
VEAIKLQVHNNGVAFIAFSVDGEYIASGSDKNMSKLWNIKTFV